MEHYVIYFSSSLGITQNAYEHYMSNMKFNQNTKNVIKTVSLGFISFTLRASNTALFCPIKFLTLDTTGEVSLGKLIILWTGWRQTNNYLIKSTH